MPRALNDRPGVAPAMRDTGPCVAAETGHVAHAPARSLRSGVTNTVGLVVESDSPAALDSNTFVALADAMLPLVATRGYDVVVLPVRHAADPLEYLRRLRQRGTADAVVISATRRQDPRIDFLVSAGLPFLALGRSRTSGDYA